MYIINQNTKWNFPNENITFSYYQTKKIIQPTVPSLWTKSPFVDVHLHSGFSLQRWVVKSAPPITGLSFLTTTNLCRWSVHHWWAVAAKASRTKGRYRHALHIQLLLILVQQGQKWIIKVSPPPPSLPLIIVNNTQVLLGHLVFIEKLVLRKVNYCFVSKTLYCT